MQLWEDFENPNWFAKSASRNAGKTSGWFAGGFRDLSQAVHEWGREQFASSYARGGFARTAFAPNFRGVMSSVGKPHAIGSQAHIRNLERLQKLNPESKGIEKALKSARAPSTTASVLKNVGGKMLGGALAVGFAVSPLFTTPGGLDTRLRATAENVAGTALFMGGMKAGSIAGAALGSLIFPGVGTAIGAVLGGIAGGFAADELGRSVVRGGFAFADKLVATERQKRHLNWVNDASAFQTRKAHTMRQQSLSAMNRGMMASRSVLGREASFVHV